jgi:hypothetical protein
MRRMGRTNNAAINYAVSLATRYYSTHPAGGNLHIVLDDGNTRDCDVSFCALECDKIGDVEGLILAALLLELTERERDRVYERYCEYSVRL